MGDGGVVFMAGGVLVMKGGTIANAKVCARCPARLEARLHGAKVGLRGRHGYGACWARYGVVLLLICRAWHVALSVYPSPPLVPLVHHCYPERPIPTAWYLLPPLTTP